MRIFFDVNVSLPFRDVFLIFLDDRQTLPARNKLGFVFFSFPPDFICSNGAHLWISDVCLFPVIALKEITSPF